MKKLKTILNEIKLDEAKNPVDMSGSDLASHSSGFMTGLDTGDLKDLKKMTHKFARAIKGGIYTRKLDNAKVHEIFSKITSHYFDSFTR